MIGDVIRNSVNVKLHIYVTENVVNNRGKLSIGVQSCESVNPLSKTKGRHNVQDGDGCISIT